MQNASAVSGPVPCGCIPDGADLFYRGDNSPCVTNTDLLSIYALPQFGGSVNALDAIADPAHARPQPLDLTRYPGEWFQTHADIGITPYLGMSKNKWTACWFATGGKVHQGCVYVLRFTDRTPQSNSPVYNNKSNPAGPGGIFVMEEEYLIPVMITESEIISVYLVDMNW